MTDGRECDTCGDNRVVLRLPFKDGLGDDGGAACGGSPSGPAIENLV